MSTAGTKNWLDFSQGLIGVPIWGVRRRLCMYSLRSCNTSVERQSLTDSVSSDRLSMFMLSDGGELRSRASTERKDRKPCADLLHHGTK